MELSVRTGVGDVVAAAIGGQIMDNEPIASDGSSRVDIKIVLPDARTIRIESAQLFADPDCLLCRRFVARVFVALEIDSALITVSAAAAGATPTLELRFDATQYGQRHVLERVATLLEAAPSCAPSVELPS